MKYCLEVQAHRGPDGEGIWTRGDDDGLHVQLGHRRLAILDLSDAGRQPMESADSSLCITFNGEIYNYLELMEELRSHGWTFRSRTDTEVLLAAYRHWGDGCLARLNGMFAFAIWDERNRSLFAARDRFGEKPFHFSIDSQSQSFAFSSEIKGLFAMGVANATLNEDSLSRLVIWGEQAGLDDTIYSGVHRLPAAHSMIVRPENGRMNVQMCRYWNPDLQQSAQTADESAERFSELFADSVRLRLRSDVPVGTSLSGGLDSSAVVCQIHKLGTVRNQETFSARMSDPRLDEGKYIAHVISATGVNNHTIVPSAESLIDKFSILCRHLEEPFPATSMFAQHLVMRLAAENDVTVLLDGQGADELLGGYRWYVGLRCVDMLRGGNILKAHRFSRKYSLLHHGEQVMGVRRVLGSLLPDKIRRMIQRRRSANTREWWSPGWLAKCLKSVGPGCVPSDSLHARLIHDACHGPLQELLRYGDRNSMACSRELRQPFLDHRLAEFAFTLPDDEKIGDGATKVILRRALRGTVPDAILDRHDKLGYEAPQSEWMLGSAKCWTESKLQQAESILGDRTPGLVQKFRLAAMGGLSWNQARNIFMLITIGECVSQLKSISASAKTACTV